MPPFSPRVKGSGGGGSVTVVTTSATWIWTCGAGADVTCAPSCTGEEIFPAKGHPSHPPGFLEEKVVHRDGPSAWLRICAIFLVVSSGEYCAYPLLHVWIKSSPSIEWHSNWMHAYQWGSLIWPRVSRIFPSCAHRSATLIPLHGGKSCLTWNAWLSSSDGAATLRTGPMGLMPRVLPAANTNWLKRSGVMSSLF